MDEAQHFSNLCTNKEYGVVEHLDTCDVRRGGKEGEGRKIERGNGKEGEGEGGRYKWVRSVRVRRGVGKGREGIEWKERGGTGESGGRAPEKRERKKGEVVRGGEGLCGDGGVGGREYSFIQKY